MRKFVIIFNVIAAAVFVVLLLSGWWAIGLGILFIAHMLLLYPTLNPYCAWWGPVVTEFGTDRKEIWLTIDDGPDPEDTPMILDLLDKHSAKATFFVIGIKARRHPELVKDIVARGHTLGNHTLTHREKSFWALPSQMIEREIRGCSEVLREITGQPVKFFRPPVGMKNLAVHTVLDSENPPLSFIGWTARGLDGKQDPNPESVVQRIVKDVRPGSIIMIHEGKRFGSGESVAGKVVPALLSELSGAGFVCSAPRTQTVPKVNRVKS